MYSVQIHWREDKMSVLCSLIVSSEHNSILGIRVLQFQVEYLMLVAVDFSAEPPSTGLDMNCAQLNSHRQNSYALTTSMPDENKNGNTGTVDNRLITLLEAQLVDRKGYELVPFFHFYLLHHHVKNHLVIESPALRQHILECFDQIVCVRSCAADSKDVVCSQCTRRNPAVGQQDAYVLLELRQCWCAESPASVGSVDAEWLHPQSGHPAPSLF